MKSRAATYTLIAGVLAVWGIILWKVFVPERDAQAPPPRSTEKKVAEDVADSLILDYRDPFLGDIVEKRHERRPEQTVTAPREVEQAAPPSVEHRLRYMGRIMRGGVPYGLVEIDGTLHTMRRGEAAGDYRLDVVWQDSVRLRWRNEMLVVGL
jgi:hypothetical protein